MKKLLLLPLICLLCLCPGMAMGATGDLLQERFQNPPAEARPWVLWYWMEACVSREGITSDLEAMAEVGIAGAYLMPIKGPADPPLMEPVEQLSPEWWSMVKHAFSEADRLGLKLAMHACDGFAVAGGPWVTPELSMQKVVWTETWVHGGRKVRLDLPQPETLRDYYRDISVFAMPAPRGSGISTETVHPKVTTSIPDLDGSFLPDRNKEGRFSIREAAWITYAFDEPFTVRSVLIEPRGNNYHAKRLRIEASDDGENFYLVRQLESPRHGWQDAEAPLTYSLPMTRARYFRFVYDPDEYEPGSEDLDSAKWRPSCRLRSIVLSSASRIHQYEGKSGLVWRISARTPHADIPDYAAVRKDSLINLSDLLDGSGTLEWDAPEGDWLILRMGHTSTGKENYIGGAGKGLEVDKFNPEAALLQYDRWFGEAIRQVGPGLAERVLKGFHLDSWECGSQNWSPVFRQEFIDAYGYDPVNWLPVMAGIPVESVERSEAFLHDLRGLISELMVKNFFGVLAQQCRAQGVQFSAESVAPVFVSDSLAHFREVDLPMGEFWLRSPSHDKPNDMADAISGGHVYGKRIIQAEAFTELRIGWDEHPGNLKTLADLNLANGINRMVFHVFAHNPWMDRAPGMTLDRVGLYFQRDQIWWSQARGWMDYLSRCQALLQMGKADADIAVYMGDDYPRRSLLPDRLAPILPGLIGPERVAGVEERLQTTPADMRELPKGVHTSSKMEAPLDWADPLSGYAYDSINQDALIRLAKVEEGKIVLPGGMRYSLLVIPGKRRMAPEGDRLDAATKRKLKELIDAGAHVLFQNTEMAENVGSSNSGTVHTGPWTADSLGSIGVAPAFQAYHRVDGDPIHLPWTRRELDDTVIYFVSNPKDHALDLECAFRVAGMVPEIGDPINGDIRPALAWRVDDGMTTAQLSLHAAEAVFVIFRESTSQLQGGTPGPSAHEVLAIPGPWRVQFDPAMGGPGQPLVWQRLTDWSLHEDSQIRHYSGPAVYQAEFAWDLLMDRKPGSFKLALGTVEDLAEVHLNGESCGIAWTAPMEVDITRHLQPGRNVLRIEVVNTWANRLIGNHLAGKNPDANWTRGAYMLGNGPLLPAGLLGPVTILKHE